MQYFTQEPLLPAAVELFWYSTLLFIHSPPLPAVVGAIKASEAANAWAAVLDRMEQAWNSKSGPIPPLRVYMRLGSLYNNLGRIDEAKVSDPSSKSSMQTAML